MIHDGMPYGRNQGQGQGQGHSREVDRQSPMGLIIVFLIVIVGSYFFWGTGIRGLMRGMATIPQGNQKLLVVRDKVERPLR